MGNKWTPEQLSAITQKGNNILVAAAAGSGKTTVLVERIIRKIIEDHVDIDKILVVTFTNAAASEMDTKLQRQLFGQIKEKISQIDRTCLPEKENRPRRVYLWFARVASVILLLSMTGLSVYYYTMSQMIMPDMIVSVEKGQKANVVLPDGSKVWVNSDSRLSYGSRFNQKERVLSLEGEAYFEVTPDKDRPFIVETDELAVRALGTSFNVKSYEEEKDVSTVLMTGKVEVTSDYDRLVLNPNERIVFNKQTGHMEKSTVENTGDYINWKYNALTFNGETFENIVHTLERYYNTRIVFESETLKKYRFTGAVEKNTSLNELLRLIESTSTNIKFEIKEKEITVTKKQGVR